MSDRPTEEARQRQERLIRAAVEAIEHARPRLDPGCIGLKKRVEGLTRLLTDALFPNQGELARSPALLLEQAAALLRSCLTQIGFPEKDEPVEALLRALPGIRLQLGRDLAAAYRGDPAARSYDEIVLCYPAFPAIVAYRLAHVLYEAGVPLLPRIMTEYAHRRTGIDIHPGAAIGDYFFIDHGTGVVIGETATIGRNVKLYQHVTLGAKSFELGPDGTPVKGIKRHPDIGDRVVIYAGATILGGDTRIGNDCVIGGSVWLTHSVPAGKLVLSRSAVLDTPLTRDLPGRSLSDAGNL